MIMNDSYNKYVHRDVIFLQCKDGIYMLTLRPLKDRIKSMVKHRHYEIAIQIKVSKIVNNSSPLAV